MAKLLWHELRDYPLPTSHTHLHLQAQVGSLRENTRIGIWAFHLKKTHLFLAGCQPWCLHQQHTPAFPSTRSSSEAAASLHDEPPPHPTTTAQLNQASPPEKLWIKSHPHNIWVLWTPNPKPFHSSAPSHQSSPGGSDSLPFLQTVSLGAFQSVDLQTFKSHFPCCLLCSPPLPTPPCTHQYWHCWIN